MCALLYLIVLSSELIMPIACKLLSGFDRLTREYAVVALLAGECLGCPLSCEILWKTLVVATVIPGHLIPCSNSTLRYTTTNCGRIWESECMVLVVAHCEHINISDPDGENHDDKRFRNETKPPMEKLLNWDSALHKQPNNCWTGDPSLAWPDCCDWSMSGQRACAAGAAVVLQWRHQPRAAAPYLLACAVDPASHLYLSAQTNKLTQSLL